MILQRIINNSATERGVASGKVHDLVDFFVNLDGLSHGLRRSRLFTLLTGRGTISTGREGGREGGREREGEGEREGGRGRGMKMDGQ